MKKNLISLLATATLLVVSLAPVVAAPPATPDVTNALKKTTLGNTPATEDFSYKADERLPELPDFTLKKGAPLSDGLPVGLLKLSGGQSFTPTTAAAAAGVEPSALLEGRLGNLKYLETMPLKDILTANPQLKTVAADSIPGFTAGNGKTLGAIVAEDSAIANSPLPADVLQLAKVSDLPGVADTSYFSYPGIEKQPVSNLFGVSNIGLDKVLAVSNTGKTDGLQLMKFDRLSTAEKNIGKAPRDNVSSGSNKEPNAPCEKDCAYGELRSTLFKGKNPLNGTKTIMGQKLKGGEGLLGDIMTSAGVREPAGYEVPYVGIGSCGSKWSINKPEARPGKVQQELHLRICYDSLIGRQATPYFIGPIPLGDASEKGNTALLPMKVTPNIDMKLPIKIEPVTTLTALPKAADNSVANASSDLSKQVSDKVAGSSLSDEQKTSIMKDAQERIKANPTAPRNTIIADAVRSSFAGSATKSDSFNPALGQQGGSADAIIKSILA
jgi:hypothetical protein